MLVISGNMWTLKCLELHFSSCIPDSRSGILGEVWFAVYLPRNDDSVASDVAVSPLLLIACSGCLVLLLNPYFFFSDPWEFFLWAVMFLPGHLMPFQALQTALFFSPVLLCPLKFCRM